MDAPPQQATPARRCFGTGDPLYEAYHDTEWGRPVHGEAPLLERIVLESFQSGLSWLTILRKREAFRRAFRDFDPRVVAAFGEADVARLLADAAIVRNRAKIASAIVNARATVSLHERGLSLEEVVWSHAPAVRDARWARVEEVPCRSPESEALAQELKGHGFRFVGPVTAYATMQACGLVYDHPLGCSARGAEAALRSDGHLSPEATLRSDGDPHIPGVPVARVGGSAT